MKSFVSTAALALAVVFAAPVMAADTTTTVTTETTAMTAEQCSEAWTKCAGDMTCQKDLEAKGCKAPTEAIK